MINGGYSCLNMRGSAVIVNCTFFNNIHEPERSAIYLSDSRIIINSILWENSIELTGNPKLVKNCIIQNGYTGPGTIDSLFTDDPLLGTLGNNGGPVPIIPIASNSPARDMGTTSVPSVVDISIDARGYVRSDGKPDIGAYEVQ
jgi:hypothetical protein